MSLPIFLQDKKFLQEIDKLHIKQQFIRITVLNWNEQPLEEIQGKTISGSVNVDGNSPMRRTASLSLFAEEKENNLANIDQLFAINKKCILEIGIVNNVPKMIIESKDQDDNLITSIVNYQQLYGNIVWYPLGIYVMFNPSVSHSMTGVTISIQLKDKMCLLNGQLGGQIHSSVDFFSQDELVDSGDSSTIQNNPTIIFNIIKQLVHHWGNEPLNKIFISEVPLKIKQTVCWLGNDPCYVVKRIDNPGLYLSREQAEAAADAANVSYDNIEEFQYGQDVGFLYTPFTYPGNQLVCAAGDTVTSVLDKIISVIGNYEYFYDLEGNFIFQEKQNYLNMTNTSYWTKETAQKENLNIFELPSDSYKVDVKLNKPIYDFINNDFTVAFNNTINFNNVKNDFVVWGLRKQTLSEVTIPCRFHLAIDKKPMTGLEAVQKGLASTNYDENSFYWHKVTYYKDDFDIIRAVAYRDGDKIQAEINEYSNQTIRYNLLDKNNKIILYDMNIQTEEVDSYILGIPVLSQDWREEIYYQMLEDEREGTGQNTEKNNSYFQYYAELKEEFPKIFNINKINAETGEKELFKSSLKEQPYEINYFLDFIDENSQLGMYSVNNIGRRAKIYNQENEGINCVFEPIIPDIVFLSLDDYSDGIDQNGNFISAGQQLLKDGKKLTTIGQNWCTISSYATSMLATGGKLNSCYEMIKDLLYQFTHMNNSISITTLPIYYFEPNTRIKVNDSPSGIQGDFIIQSFSLPLDINSTMNINAYQALQKI